MKNDKTLNRFLAFLLCAAMLVTYMPSAAFTLADESADNPESSVGAEDSGGDEAQKVSSKKASDTSAAPAEKVEAAPEPAEEPAPEPVSDQKEEAKEIETPETRAGPSEESEEPAEVKTEEVSEPAPAEEPAPEETVKEEAAPAESAAEEAAPEETVAEEAAQPEETVEAEAAPAQVASEEAAPAEAAQPEEKAEAEDAAAEEAAPAEAVKEEAAEEVKEEAAEEVKEEAVEEEKEEEEAEEKAEEAEKDAYPAQSFQGSAGGVSVSVSAPEGALPEGTKMSVTSVSASQVMGAVESVVDGEVKTVKAVDITFRKDGKEIEPKKAVSVRMSASGMENEGNQSVVHISDSGNASVVTEAVNNGSATFSAKDFSIYLVVEEDQSAADENAVATYEFYVDDKLVMTQYIKTGDKITDPGSGVVGADDANTVFKGWFIGETAVDFDNAQTVDETTTIRVDAKIQHTYYVTFWGEKDSEGNRGIVAVKSVTVEGSVAGEVTTDDVSVTPKADTSAFKGWATDDAGTDMVGATVEVSDRMDLYAVVVKAHWLHFYENVGEDSDSDATYTGPVFIAETDLRSSKRPSNPTRQGYEFAGWYLEKECNTAFDWSKTGLDKDTNLYAKWNPIKADYKVIIWKQKVTDDKDAGVSEKTYDFESGYDEEGTTGTTIDLSQFSAYTNLNYTGFHYARMEASPATIRADGTTVVNVYYDRNRLTISLIDGSHTEYVEATDNSGTQYGLVDGEYIRLNRYGNTWSYTDSGIYNGTYYHQVHNNNGTQYGIVDGELVELTRRNNQWYNGNTRYYGDRYATGTASGWNTTYGLVGGELVALDYDYWTGGYEYNITRNYTGTRYKMATVPTETTMTGLYGQTLAQNDYTWPTEQGYGWYQNPNAGGTRLTFLDTFKFDGLSGVSSDNTVLTQYKGTFNGSNTINFYKQGLDGNWVLANTVYASNNSTFTITEKYEGFSAYQYHNNNSAGWRSIPSTSVGTSGLEIRFARNDYSITYMSEGAEVGKKENVPYESSLADYKIADPTKEHYDFAGWYEDVSLNQEVDWSSKMPAANKVLYAKWTPKQYHVILDPNGGKFKNAQVGEFNVPLDTILDKTSLTTNVEKDKHELVGWFDKETGEVYGFGKVESDVSLIAKWRYPGQVKIVYDAGVHGSGAPTDTYMYATDSSVVLGAPPTTIDEGYAFIGWSVGGKKYYTNNTFDITESLIKNYDETTKTGTVTITAIYQDLTKGAYEKTSITYKANGGSGDDVIVKVDGSLLVNEPVTALPATTFTRDGYDFTGWNTMADGSGLAVAAGANIAADLKDLDKNTKINTLYAQWVKTYTVTFDTDGGTPASIDSQTVKSGEKATKPADPTKDNNDFLGWFEEGSETAFDFSTPITKDTNLKAKWDPKTVTVTFDANGHGTAPAAQTVNKGEKASKPTDPTETGYTFGGWYTDADCTDEFDFNTAVNEDITLYAKWTINKYKVNFEYGKAGDLNGLLKLEDGSTTQYYSDNLDYGTATPKVTPVPNPGYEFKAWEKKTDSATTTVDTPDATVTEDVTYTATWTPKTDTEYTVNWYYQTPGSEEYKLKKTETRTGTTGETVYLEAGDETPEDQGDGYTYEENGSKTKTKTDITGDGKAEMHVYFWPVYNITFLAGDHGKIEDASGTPTDEVKRVKHYGEMTPNDWNYPKHPDKGYNFEKWTPEIANTVTGHATYVAQWALNKHTVTYEYTGEIPEGAPEVPEAKEYEYGAEVPAATEPTLEGYTFSGWEGEVETMPDEDVTVTGRWTAVEPEPEPTPTPTPATHTVTYRYTGTVPAGAPAVPAAATYRTGDNVEVAEAPTMDGYTFSGWSRSGNFSMPDRDVIITGRWTAIPEDEDDTEDDNDTPSGNTNPGGGNNNPGGGNNTPDDGTPAVTPGGGGTPAVTPGGGGTPVAAAVVPAPAAPAAPVTPAAPTINDNPTPAAEPNTETEIAEPETPLAQGTWALLNLLSAIVTTLGAAVALFRKKEDDDEEDDQNGEKKAKDEDEDDNRGKKMLASKIIGAVAGVAAPITFFLTEDMSNPMVMTDKWTVLMLAMLAAQVVAAVANKKSSEADDNKEEAEAAN